MKIADLENLQMDRSKLIDTIDVFEDLLEYYQNVALCFKDFIAKYTSVKKEIVESQIGRSYDEVMKEINDERHKNTGTGYRHYEIIKVIGNLLTEEEKMAEKRSRASNKTTARRYF